MQITNIVITGGPCAGKSAAMPLIKETFTNKGYTVLFIPETATELIIGGVCPWTTGKNQDYQLCQCQLQTFKEDMKYGYITIKDKAGNTQDCKVYVFIDTEKIVDDFSYKIDNKCNYDKE